MEERQDNTKNIKSLGQILKDGNLDKLLDKIKQAQGKASSIMKKLGEKQAEFKAREAAEAQSEFNAEEAAHAVENVSPAAEKKAAASVKADESVKSEITETEKQTAAAPAGEKAEVKAEKTEKSEKTETVKADSSVKAENAEKTVKAEKIEKSEAKADAKEPVKAAENKETEKAESADKKAEKVQGETVKNAGEKKEAPSKTAPVKAEKQEAKPEKQEVKAEVAKTAESKEAKEPAKEAEKPAEPPKKSILSFIVKKADPTKPQQREFTADGKRIFRNNDRNGSPDRNGNRPPRNGAAGQNGQQRAPYGQRPFGAGASSSSFAGGAGRPAGLSRKPQEISFVPPKDNKPVKKKAEKSYDDKRVQSKKAHIKELTIADFDENKTGYRKLRKPKTQKKEEQSNFIKIEKAVLTKELTPIKELSEKLGISAVEICKRLFKEGITKNINDSVDYDTAAFIAADLGIEVELKMEKSAEELMNEGFNEEKDDESVLVKRPPIVTVMGHVDHGKTSLLDRIRSANVADGEAGGITQHIGAYSVDLHGNKITFIDTPGHAAFTSMRARGAQVTDIAVIVVAADDGIMPQTIEAINHAKAAGVSIIVAANKIDKPHVDLDRLRQQLSEQELLVEDWGGDIMMIPVSAKTGAGVEDLLEAILTVAEMRELKANPNRKARGTVIEAKLDKGKGPMATVLVQNGTLRTGDNVVAGTVVGRVRAMINDKGANVKEAGPSVAVSILGLEEVPNAGDAIFAVDEEKLSKLVAEERKNKEREIMIRQQSKVTLDDLFSKISDGELKSLNLIIKADVQGSAEAVRQSLTELSNDEVKVNVLHAAVGAINETDVMLADSANAIIIGFNVRPDVKAKTLAERSHVDIKLYRIIYEAIDDVKKAMKGMLAPKFTDEYTGKAEVRNTFKISGVGTVAGCYVTDGKIVRSAKLRIYRDDVMICEGNVMQLKRFKDEVKEVAQGYECGISIEGFNDIKVGDFIESYIVVENKD